jgi:hypothetical protein
MLIGGAPDKASPSLLDAGAGFLVWRPMALALHPKYRTTFGIGQGLPVLVPVLYYLLSVDSVLRYIGTGQVQV